MPTEPPQRPTGSRGDGAPKGPKPPAGGPAHDDDGHGGRGRGAKPESLREALSRIPDIERESELPRRPTGADRGRPGRPGPRRPAPGEKDFGLGPVPPGTEKPRPRSAGEGPRRSGEGARRPGEGPRQRPAEGERRPGTARPERPGPGGAAPAKPGQPAAKKRPLPVRPPRDVISSGSGPSAPGAGSKAPPSVKSPAAGQAPAAPTAKRPSRPAPATASGAVKPKSASASKAPAGPAQASPAAKSSSPSGKPLPRRPKAKAETAGGTSPQGKEAAGPAPEKTSSDPNPEVRATVAALATIAATKASAAVTIGDAKDTEAPVERADEPAPAERGHRFKADPEPARDRQPWWRRLGFAAAVILLAASIPVLGREGYRLVSQSRDGTVGPGAPGPTDPGYEELVTSTPTALIIQKDSEGLPVALTFLALSNGDSGGSVIFVPLDTEVPEPGFGVDRLRTTYSAVADDPVGATAQLSGQTGKVLNVGIDETFELDDRGWTQLVAPVAPLTIDNPEPIDLPTGTLASGEVALAADQVGPYLAATRQGEDGVAAFFRQELVLRAWLSAVAAQDDGAGSGDLADYINTLARGEVTFATVPGEFAGGFPEPVRYEPDASALNDLVTELVPAPDAPAPGARITVRLLNGVQAGAFPGDVIRTVVSMQGSVSVLGNGPSFGRTETTILYSDPAKEAYARALLDALGGTGEVTQDPSLSDLIDLTVILGSDVIGDDPSGGVSTTAAPAAASSTTTTADPGLPVFQGGTTTSEPGGL